MVFQISQDDSQFKDDVESCSFPVANFDHRAHLRLAYIYLVQSDDVSEAVYLVRQTLIALLMHAGIEPSEKYHETLTEAWLLAVHYFMHVGNQYNSADEFIDSNPKLLDSKIMLTHYSKERLFSESAKSRYLEPDLEPIPRFVS